VELCQRLPLSGFLQHYADAYFLLIRLWERDDALTTSLMSRAEQLSGVAASATPYSTTAEYESSSARLASGQPFPAPNASGVVPSSQRDLCFLMAVRRGAEPNKARRLALGRSRSCDLWTHHRSISQQHAWFGFDDAGRLQLTDADSKNKTLIEGDRVKDQPVFANVGAVLQFGAVRATVCAPAAIWTTLVS